MKGKRWRGEEAKTKGREGERELVYVCVQSVVEVWGPLVHQFVGNAGSLQSTLPTHNTPLVLWGGARNWFTIIHTHIHM